MESARARTVKFAQEFIENGDPLGWFEPLYAMANEDATTVPWADLTANPVLVEWLQETQIRGDGKKALVVGCGLGDDAEELAKLGFEVTAFDISPTAIAWCQKRFSDSLVQYCVADVFATPEDWQHHFDFILECYTIQSMPPEIRARAIPGISDLLAPTGTLLVITQGRSADQPLTTVPFPLSKAELTGFQAAGLTEVEFKDLITTDQTRRFRVLYTR